MKDLKLECQKKAFLTKEEAIKRISEIRLDTDGDRKPVRSYRCQYCDKFHLTSWTKNKKLDVENKKLSRQNMRMEDEIEYWRKRKGWKDWQEPNKK